LWKDEDIRVVHYIQDDKPWKIPPPKTNDVPYEETDRWWWKSYDSMVTAMADGGLVEDITYIEGLVGPRH
jgi:lipopolysaccharide biosynthesis glycosyltransferase